MSRSVQTLNSKKQHFEFRNMHSMTLWHTFASNMTSMKKCLVNVRLHFASRAFFFSIFSDDFVKITDAQTVCLNCMLKVKFGRFS